jgi:hypothetical protein
MNDSSSLRRAAALIRKRAEMATPGPWEASSGDVYETRTQHGDVIAESGLSNLDARHIALWHPGRAALVADILEAQAALRDDLLTPLAQEMGSRVAGDREAFALAASILGEGKGVTVCPTPENAVREHDVDITGYTP